MAQGSRKRTPAMPTPKPRAAHSGNHNDTRLTLRTREGVRVMRIAEIATVSACENYTEVQLATGERLFVRRTMKAWLALLPTERFVRVHRQTIINLERLRGWRRLTNDTSLITVEGCSKTVRASYRYLGNLRIRLERQ
jgi:DNA-binding LytR/AlgR family response regulator